MRSSFLRLQNVYKKPEKSPKWVEWMEYIYHIWGLMEVVDSSYGWKHRDGIAEKRSECPKTLDFWGAWLQIGCKNVLSICCRNNLNMYLRNAAEESAAFWEKVIDMWV